MESPLKGLKGTLFKLGTPILGNPHMGSCTKPPPQQEVGLLESRVGTHSRLWEALGWRLGTYLKKSVIPKP